MKNLWIALLFANLVFFGCQQPNHQNEQATTEEEKVVVPEPEMETALDISIVPEAHRTVLGTQCTGIEASFYYSAKSMSSRNCLSILNMVEAFPPSALSKKEQGHIAFIVDNEVYCMAKIVMDGQTNYLRFDIQDSSYYHAMNSQGIEFFAGMITDTPIPAE